MTQLHGKFGHDDTSEWMKLAAIWKNYVTLSKALLQRDDINSKRKLTLR